MLCCAVFRSMGSELSTGRILVQDRRSVVRSVSHASQPDGSRLGAHGWRKQGECAQIKACTAGQGKVLARGLLRPREKSREDGRLVGSEPNITMGSGSEAVAIMPARLGHRLQPSLVGVGSCVAVHAGGPLCVLSPGSLATVSRVLSLGLLSLSF